jgi:hypothetical protein
MTLFFGTCALKLAGWSALRPLRAKRDDYSAAATGVAHVSRSDA